MLRKPVGHASNLIEFKPRIHSDGPQDPEPLSHIGRSRPCTYVLDDHRDNILAAARRGRNYRHIAKQYGVSALEIWRIVTDALQVKRAA